MDLYFKGIGSDIEEQDLKDLEDVIKNLILFMKDN